MYPFPRIITLYVGEFIVSYNVQSIPRGIKGLGGHLILFLLTCRATPKPVAWVLNHLLQTGHVGAPVSRESGHGKCDKQDGRHPWHWVRPAHWIQSDCECTFYHQNLIIKQALKQRVTGVRRKEK